MSARVLTARVLASVFFTMTIVAIVAVFLLTNLNSATGDALVETWATVSFLTMVGSFLGAMIVFSVAADAFSAQE